MPIESFLNSAGRWLLESGNPGPLRRRCPVLQRRDAGELPHLHRDHRLCGQHVCLPPQSEQGSPVPEPGQRSGDLSLPYGVGSDAVRHAVRVGAGSCRGRTLQLFLRRRESSHGDCWRYGVLPATASFSRPPGAAASPWRAISGRRRGEYHPIIRLPGKTPIERDWRWSRNSGCYQLKAALAWLELAEATGEKQYAELYEQVLEQALRTHEKFLPGHAERSKVMDRLHAYSYFLEGLLPVLDRPRCRRAFESGTVRARNFFRQIAPGVRTQSDVSAQLLRARVYAESIAGIAPDGLAARERVECRPDILGTIA